MVKGNKKLDKIEKQKKTTKNINKIDSNKLVDIYNKSNKDWSVFFKVKEVKEIKEKYSKTQEKIKEHIYNKKRTLENKTPNRHGKIIREQIVNGELNPEDSPDEMETTNDLTNQLEKDLLKDNSEDDEVADSLDSTNTSKELNELISNKQQERQSKIELNKNLKNEQIHEIRESRALRERANMANTMLQTYLMKKIDKLDDEENKQSIQLNLQKKLILEVIDYNNPNIKFKIGIDEKLHIKDIISKINQINNSNYCKIFDEDE
jgi:hypothetical protein